MHDVQSIHQLHAKHASALVAEATQKKELDAAQAAYDKLLEQFKKQHPDVVNRLENAREKHAKAAEVAKSVDWEVRTLLTGVKFNNLPSGYEQVRKKKVVYNEKTLLQAAIQYAPWMLTIDEKKVEDFAFAVCEEVTHSTTGEKLAEPYFMLPEHYRPWMPSLHVNFDWSPRISKAKVEKHGDVKPETSSVIDDARFITEDSDGFQHIRKNDVVTLCGKPINWKVLHSSWDYCPHCLAIRKDIVGDEPLPDTVKTDEPQPVDKSIVVNAGDLLQNNLKVTIEPSDESPSGVLMTFEVGETESENDSSNINPEPHDKPPF